MIKQYSYFQFDGELDLIRVAIERALAIRLLERDSSYLGGTYYLYKDDALRIHLQLYRNVDEHGGWINGEFKDARIVCDVSGPVEAVGQLIAELPPAGGRLLVTRVSEIEDD